MSFQSQATNQSFRLSSSTGFSHFAAGDSSRTCFTGDDSPRQLYEGSQDSEVSAQLELFEQARLEEVKAEFHDVLAVGLHCVFVGVLLTVVTVIDQLPVAAWVMSVVGSFSVWIFSGGIVLLSTIPTSQVDIDEFGDLHITHRVALCFTLAGWHLKLGLDSEPHFVFFTGFFIAAQAAFPRLQIMKLSFSTSLILWFAIDCFGWASWHSWIAGHDNKQGDTAAEAAGTTLESWAVRWLHAFLDWLRGVVILVTWLKRRQQAGYEGKRTRAFYAVLYVWILTAGAQLLFFEPFHVSLYITHGTAADVMGSFTNIMRGLAITTPVLTVLIIGRKRFFYMSARRFNRNTLRSSRDGAFIASLLDASTVTLGQVWWIHLPADQKDRRFPPQDRRHNWRRGRVADLGLSDFKVALPASNGLPLETLVLDRASSAHTTRELMEKARAELRCFDWSRFSEEVLTSGQGRGDFELSREAGPDEKIDFFLSHSWHDDGEAKYEVLEAMVLDFELSNGRDPTFWLDKVCIDQRNIRDGLRVLPVNVMACRQVLAIWGSTYPKRLWCMWELFTLLAFSPNIELVVARITVLPLSDDIDEGRFGGIGEQLQRFHVERAQCYDPNEERQLRAVINAMGPRRFNERMWELGRACSSSISGCGGTPGLTSTRMSRALEWFHTKSHKLPRKAPWGGSGIRQGSQEDRPDGTELVKIESQRDALKPCAAC